MAHSGFTPYSHRDFIKQLRQLLQDRYTWDGDGFSILKELIQNANDAGATRLDLGWVPAVGGRSARQATSLRDEQDDDRAAHPLLHSAALFALNDGPFQSADAANITRLGSNSKAGEATTAGRFGLGLKSVFHLCEAFFYLASPFEGERGRICRIFNPWSPPPGCDDPGPYEDWDFGSDEPRAAQVEEFIRHRLLPVFQDNPQFFCLWIPLRDPRLLRRNPIVPGEIDDSRLKSMISQEGLGHRLAELLPFLHSLQTIRIWSPTSDGMAERFRVQLGEGSRALPRLPDVNGDEYPQSRQTKLTGQVMVHVSDQPTDRCGYVGRESITESESLQELWKHRVWPKDESLDPVTDEWRDHRAQLIPHGAVRFMATPATNRSARLSMHWCVFLPLGSEHFEIDTTLSSDVSIFLHGYFFVDSGRKRHIKTRFAPELSRSLDVEHLQQEWNAEIEAQAVWPFVLESLADFVTRLKWNDRQVEEMTRGLHILLTRFGDDALAAVAAKKQWLYTLGATADGQVGWQWSLKSANTPVCEIPRIPPQVRVAALLPGLVNTDSRLLITTAGLPRIASTEQSPWSATRLKRVIATVDSDLALSSIDNVRYLVELLEQCACSDDQTRAAGEALWPVLKTAFQSVACDFTRFKSLEQPLKRLLEFVPEEHRLILPWATADRDRADVAFRVVAATESDLLPIPSFLRPSGRDCRRLESRLVVEVLEQIVDLSLDRSLLADVVGDLLDRADLDRASLARHLAKLRLLVVSNLQTSQMQRVTWAQIQEQKRRRLLFCDQAGLTRQLQSAIGSAGDVWRIDPDFAKKVLGDGHDLPGCSARECARILSPSREGTLDHFSGDQLGEWTERQPLLESLSAELGRGSSNDQERLKDACRLLIHGRIPNAGFKAPFFVAAEGESDPLAEKLTRHVLVGRVDIDARSKEEWRIIDGQQAVWASKKLNQEQRECLDLVPLRFAEPAVLSFFESVRPEQLAGLDVTEDEYGHLLEILAERNADLLKRLPVHPTIAGDRVVIPTDGSRPAYWDNGYRLDGDLQHSTVLLRMHNNPRLHRYQEKLADVLGPQQIVDIDLHTASPERYWKALLRATVESTERFPDDILQSLRTQRWLPSRHGARSCDDLICLTLGESNEEFTEGFVAEINRLVDDCGAAYVPDWFLDEQLQRELRRGSQTASRRLREWNLLPDLEKSLQHLSLLLAERSENFIGYLSPERFEQWLSIDWDVELMPAHGMLKVVAERFGAATCYRHASWNIREPIDDIDRLQRILQALSEAHARSDVQASREKLLSMFHTYFNFLLSHSRFKSASQLRSLRLLSQEGSWKPCAQLCLPPASGIARGHILADELATLVSEDGLVALKDDTRSTERPAEASPSRQSATPSDSSEYPVAIVERYFRSWEGSLPNDVIGGFIGLLGGDPGMEALANRYLGKRSLDETRRNLLITPTGIGPRQIRMSDQRVRVVLVSEQFALATSMLGEQFEAPLASDVESLLVGFGTGRHVEVDGPDAARTLSIQLRSFNPMNASYDAETLTQMVADAAEIILVEGLKLRASDDTHTLVQKTFQDLRESDQLEIRVTQQLILEDAELLLSQLGLQSDEVFGPVLAELTKHKRLRAERDHNEQRFNRKASWTEQEVEEEHSTPNQRLRNLLENDDDGQRRVLQAVRQRIQGHNQYNAAAIPFELFQNADDACEERRQLLDRSIDCHTLRYFIRKDILAIQHCGRCINQVPPGADPRTHKLSDDLRKMLTPWLSSKDVADPGSAEIQLTGKFGLGFKSVFLVSDQPRILSGRIACEIVGGVFPKYMGVDEQASFDHYTEGFTSDARREVTVIELPLPQNDAAGKGPDNLLQSPIGPIIARFVELTHLLVVFARQIRRIEIRRDSDRRQFSASWTDTSVPGVAHCFKGAIAPLPNILGTAAAEARVAATPERVIVLRCTRHGGALLLTHDGQRFQRLPDEVPTLWVTAPTLHCLKTGCALNANFSLDPGRAQLGRESPENERIARDLGRDLGDRLVGLFQHSRQVGWKQFCLDVGFDPTAKEYEVWDSLWELLGPPLARLPDTSNDATLLRQIFWGEEGAALRLYRECSVLPGRLEGASFRHQLSTLSQVRFAVHGMLSSDDGYGLMCVRDWPSFSSRVGNGHFVSEPLVACHLRAFDVRRDKFDLADVLAWDTEGLGVSPDQADRYGTLIDGNFLRRCDRTEEQRILSKCRELRFKDQLGQFQSAGRLLIGHQPQGVPSDSRSDERMRAAFAPSDRILSAEYSASGVAFFEVCRGPFKAPASELAAWVRRADSDTKKRASLLYLADGELGRAVQNEVKSQGGIRGTWLEHFAKSNAFQAMTPAQQARLLGLLPEGDVRRILQPGLRGSEPSCPPHPDPEQVLSSIYDWWSEEEDREIAEYEGRIYPDRGLYHLKGDRNELFRKDWVVLFLLGLTHTMGRTVAEQHRGFLIKNASWLNMVASSERDPASWLNWINEFLDEQVDDARFLQWMKQFVGIYQISRHLDVYIAAFENVELVSRPFPLTEITAPLASPFFQGGGFDAPPLTRILGMGQCFVLRELVRKGVIRNALAFPHCYVPVKRVRELLMFLGCDPLKQPSRKWEMSRDIHRFLVDRMGSQKATFNRAFDIPLQLVAEDPGLQKRFFQQAVQFTEGEEDLWIPPDETSPG